MRQPVCPFSIPQLRLAAFEKVYLEPGESRTLSFQLQPDQLRVYDEAGVAIHVPGRIEMVAAFSLPIQRSRDLGASEPVMLAADLV